MRGDLISRQAAIEEIEPYTDDIYNSTAIEIKEILQRLPSVQPSGIFKANEKVGEKKMTIEKAIEQLEDLIKEAESHMTGNKIDGEIPIDDKTALEMAIQALDEMTIQALEKQLPKKVKREFATEGGRITCFETDVCPACGSDLYIEDLGQTMDYSFCPNCGQALYWSDSDD